jgi:DNA-binding MarR family transcriptional regulator
MTSSLQQSTVLPVASDSLLQHMAHTYHEVATLFERKLGLSRARWMILAILSREAESSQAALAHCLQVDAAAITRQVQQLEKEGLVTRRPDPADNRFTLVSLTPAGRAYLEGLRSARDHFEAAVTQGLSADEIDTMRRYLTRIRQNVRALSQQP